MKIRGFIFFLILACTLPFTLSACDTEGPAEEAGENVDEATEEAGEAAENARDQAEEMGDEAGRQTDN